LGYERAKLILKDLCGAGLLAEVPNEKDKRQNKYVIVEGGVSSEYPTLEHHISHGELEPSEGDVKALSPSESAEKCELCGLRAVEWKVYFNGQWLKRCSQCLERMKASGLKLHYLPLTESETNEA